MTEDHIVLLVLETLGGTMLILGYLIKYKQKLSLIAGIHKHGDQIRDKEKFASLVGGNVLLSGIVFSMGAIGMFFYPGYKNMIEPVLLLSLLATVLLTYTRSKKYIKKSK